MMPDSVFRATLIAEYRQHRAECGSHENGLLVDGTAFLNMTPRILAGYCLQWCRPHGLLENLAEELLGYNHSRQAQQAMDKLDAHIPAARLLIERALAADKAGKGQPSAGSDHRHSPHLLGGGA